jgi:hypothetical protein
MVEEGLVVSVQLSASCHLVRQRGVVAVEGVRR